MTCEHEQLTNDGFLHYHYCIRCKKRVHTVMDGFTVIRFVECLENKSEPNDVFGMDEGHCNCKDKVELKEGERLV